MHAEQGLSPTEFKIGLVYRFSLLFLINNYFFFWEAWFLRLVVFHFETVFFGFLPSMGELAAPKPTMNNGAQTAQQLRERGNALYKKGRLTEGTPRIHYDRILYSVYIHIPLPSLHE